MNQQKRHKINTWKTHKSLEDKNLQKSRKRHKRIGWQKRQLLKDY